MDRDSQFVRFIPACAGNRGGRRIRPPRPAVHPRVCGEQVPRVTGGKPTGGSSPRVRGTVCVSIRLKLHHRFIPACAGNSPSSRRGWVTKPVHPRVCGEQDDEVPF